MMDKKVGVLILHGIGIQEKEYSIPMQNKINNLLKGADYDHEQVAYQEVLYSKVFDDQQEKRSKYLINTSAKFQLISRFIRWLLIFILSDAVSYRARYKRVHKHISENK